MSKKELVSRIRTYLIGTVGLAERDVPTDLDDLVAMVIASHKSQRNSLRHFYLFTVSSWLVDKLYRRWSKKNENRKSFN